MRAQLCILFASLLLASCVPSTTPSETALKPDALGLGTDNSPPIAADWWKDFNDPKLDALVDAALAQNPSLAAALARLRVAQSGLSEAEAGTFPQVTFDAQEQRERFSKDYIIPPPFGGTTQWMGTIQANLSWEIDLWGRQAALVDKARSSAQAAGLDAAGARLALSGAMAEAYVGLSRANALVSIARQTLDDRNHVLALTRTQYNSGIENNGAVKLAEALAAQASQDLTRTNAARELLIHDIAALAGRGADAYPAIEASAPSETALALPATLPADLLARRPDILAAQARIDAAVSGRRVARTAFYPDVNLLAFAGWQAIGLGTLFSGSSLAYGAGPAVHLPIFDAGKIRAEYAGATAALDEAVADYNQTVIGAVHQTADALTQVRALESERGDEEHALAAAETSYRLAETRYRSGLSDLLVLLQTEDTLLARTAGQGQSRRRCRVEPHHASHCAGRRLPIRQTDRERRRARKPGQDPMTDTVFQAAARLDARRFWLLVLGCVVAVCVVAYGIYWLTYARYFESTNDAYVGGDVISVTSREVGYRARAPCRQHANGAARPAADRARSHHRQCRHAVGGSRSRPHGAQGPLGVLESRRAARTGRLGPRRGRAGAGRLCKARAVRARRRRQPRGDPARGRCGDSGKGRARLRAKQPGSRLSIRSRVRQSQGTPMCCPRSRNSETRRSCSDTCTLSRRATAS